MAQNSECSRLKLKAAFYGFLLFAVIGAGASALILLLLANVKQFKTTKGFGIHVAASTSASGLLGAWLGYCFHDKFKPADNANGYPPLLGNLPINSIN